MEILRAEQEMILRDKKLMEELLDNAGWARLHELAQGNIHGMQQTFLEQGITGLDDAFQSANNHGRVAGMKTILATPYSYLEDLIRQLDHLETRISEAQDE